MDETLKEPKEQKKKRPRIRATASSNYSGNTSSGKHPNQNQNFKNSNNTDFSSAHADKPFNEKISETLERMKRSLEEYKKTINRNPSSSNNAFKELEKYMDAYIGRFQFLNNKQTYLRIKSLFNNFSSYKSPEAFDKLLNLIKEELANEDYKKVKELAEKIAHSSVELKDELKDLLLSKDSDTLSKYKVLSINSYKNNRTAVELKKVNAILEPLGGKIEISKQKDISFDEKKASRAAFNGFFSVPSDSDLSSGKGGHSKVYSDFLNEERGNAPKSYNLDKCIAWQEYKKAFKIADIEIPDAKLVAALNKIKMPAKYVESAGSDDTQGKINTVDIARILFDEYANQPAKLSETSTLSFDTIMNEGVGSTKAMFAGSGMKFEKSDCSKDSEGLNKKFWQEVSLADEQASQAIKKDLMSHGVSEKYIDECLFPSIKNYGIPNPKVEEGQYPGVIPVMTIHHKKSLNDYGSIANDMTNFMAIPEFPEQESEHDLRHLTDNEFNNKKEFKKRIVLVKNEDTSKDVPEYRQLRQGEKPNDNTDVFIERYIEKYDENSHDGKSLIYSSGSKPENNVMADVRSNQKKGNFSKQLLEEAKSR